MILLAFKSGWPDRVVSWNHTGPVPDGHMAVESIAELDEWKSAHPELTPQPEQQPEPVPEEVAGWALREICLDRGHTEEIEAAFARLDPKTAAKARNRWLSKQTLSRDCEYIVAMQKLLRWTDDYVNDLFQAAAAL